MKKGFTFIFTLLLLSLVTVAQAQEPDQLGEPNVADEPAGEEAAVDCEHPRVVYLVGKTGAACQEILDLHAAGVGFGHIMKAAVIAEGVAGDWQTLLGAHLDGAGWGQLGQAHGLSRRFAAIEATPEELLALKESGLGWGQISKAYALADAGLGVSAEEAAAMMREGMGWEEIQAALGLEAGGPPPWAGGPANQGDGGPGNNGRGNGTGNSGNGNNGNNGNGRGNGNGNGGSDDAGGDS